MEERHDDTALVNLFCFVIHMQSCNYNGFRLCLFICSDKKNLIVFDIGMACGAEENIRNRIALDCS